MRVYNYDEHTGEFIGWLDAQADPLENPAGEPDKPWLIPAFATTIRPPTLVFGNVVVFRNGKWGYLLSTDEGGELSDIPILPPELSVRPEKKKAPRKTGRPTEPPPQPEPPEGDPDEQLV